MPSPATGPARLARAFVVAVSTVSLALGAHVLGGGDVPQAIVVVPLAAVVLAAAMLFTGRRIGAAGALAMLGLGQLGLHQAFGVLSDMGCEPAAAMAGHAHTVQIACTAAAPPHVAGVGGSSMLLLHVVATLATALLIAGTDRTLAWITTWLRPLLALLAPVVVPALALLPVKVETPHVVGRRHVGVVPLRGPPAWPAHATSAA